MLKDNIIDSELKFYCAAVFNFFDSMICSYIDVSLTYLPVLFMSYAVAFLEELSKRLSKIGKKANLKDVDSIEEAACAEELVECVKLHLKIKEFTRNIEKHFSTMILVQGLMSSIVFCTLIYILSKVI